MFESHNEGPDARRRGKSAIDSVHSGISRDDEVKLDAKISEMYGAGIEEATEIHTNYHAERIFTILERRAREKGMTLQTLADRVQHLDITNVAFHVVKGQLTEPAAVDMLFRNLYIMESNGADNDRYINFYG